MEHFKELRESGLYFDSNPVHVDCLTFCYMDLIRDELHRFARLWNNHRIRPELIEGNGYEGRQTSEGELFVKVFGMSRDFEGAHIDFKMAASV